MKSFALFVACLALASMAHAQCPITSEEASALSFKAVSSACSGVGRRATFEDCDSCLAALAAPLQPLLPKFGLECANIPNTPAAVQGSLTDTLTPCFQVLQGPLQRDGVNVLSLVNLRSCPTDKFGPKLESGIKAACPDWTPGR